MKFALIAMAVFVPLVALFFRWRKAKTMKRLEGFVDAAQVATFLRLAASSGGDRRADSYAGAVTNHLFAKPPDHQGEFDASEIEATAQAILEQDRRVREVVVQSLRVINKVQYGDSWGHPPIGKDVLSRYGAKYPSAPDPRSFARLVASYADELGAGEDTTPPGGTAPDLTP